MLKNEGIDVTDDYTVDMQQYRFHPTKEFLYAQQLGDDYIQQLIQKYGL
jgi:hypothetical protein